jgi:hypothetical protein
MNINIPQRISPINQGIPPKKRTIAPTSVLLEISSKQLLRNFTGIDRSQIK